MKPDKKKPQSKHSQVPKGSLYKDSAASYPLRTYTEQAEYNISRDPKGSVVQPNKKPLTQEQSVDQNKKRMPTMKPSNKQDSQETRQKRLQKVYDTRMSMLRQKNLVKKIREAQSNPPKLPPQVK